MNIRTGSPEFRPSSRGPLRVVNSDVSQNRSAESSCELQLKKETSPAPPTRPMPQLMPPQNLAQLNQTVAHASASGANRSPPAAWLRKTVREKSANELRPHLAHISSRDINRPEPATGTTLLLEAASHSPDLENVLRLLIDEKGARVDACAKDGSTVLTRCLARADQPFDAITFLLRRNARIEPGVRANGPLHLVLMSDWPQALSLVQMLRSRHASLRTSNAEGWLPLALAAQHRWAGPLIAALLQTAPDDHARQRLMAAKSVLRRGPEMTAAAAALLFADDPSCYDALVALRAAGASLTAAEAEAIAIERSRLPHSPRRSPSQIAEMARQVREGKRPQKPTQPILKSRSGEKMRGESLVAPPAARTPIPPEVPHRIPEDDDFIDAQKLRLGPDSLQRYEHLSFDVLVSGANPEVVEGFLARDPRLIIRASTQASGARLPIARAVETKQRKTLEVLLRNLSCVPTLREEAINTAGIDRRTALHLAIEGNDIKAVAMLLRAGADPFTKVALPAGKRLSRVLSALSLSGTKTADALMFAAARDRAAAVRLLLQWDEGRPGGKRRYDPDALYVSLHTSGQAPSPDVSRELRAGVARRTTETGVLRPQ